MRRLVQGHYTILHMAGLVGQQPEWEGQQQLPALEEVTAEVLKRDLWDAWRLANNSLGCIGEEASAQLQKMKGPSIFGERRPCSMIMRSDVQ